MSTVVISLLTNQKHLTNQSPKSTIVPVLFGFPFKGEGQFVSRVQNVVSIAIAIAVSVLVQKNRSNEAVAFHIVWKTRFDQPFFFF